jgi:hypothetical protein
MAKFIVDASAVLHLAGEEFEGPGDHELLAPTLIRSQVLSGLHEAVHRGELQADVALDRLDRIARIPIRLLGDAVLRSAGLGFDLRRRVPRAHAIAG